MLRVAHAVQRSEMEEGCLDGIYLVEVIRLPLIAKRRLKE